MVAGFPLRTSLAGVSVQVTVGDRTVDALILEVRPAVVSYPGTPAGFSVRALLPSGTPLGVASSLVRYKGDPSAGSRPIGRALGDRAGSCFRR